MQEIDDPRDDPAGDWDREHDREILRRLFEDVANEFEEKTLQAFCRHAFDGVAAPEVAAELGMTLGAVYIAKSRVLRRLREEAEGLIDEGTG